VPEVIDDGVSGVIVNSMSEAVQAFPELMSLDRKIVRRTFEERFTVRRMAEDYVALYRSLIAKDANMGTNGRRPSRASGARPEIGAMHARED
jgi:hypothetical protein